MVHNRLKLLGFSVLFAVMVTAAVLYLTRPGPVDVVVATITRGTVEDTTANTRAGTVKARRHFPGHWRSDSTPACEGRRQG